MLAIQANGATIPILGLGTWDLRAKTCTRIVEQALRLGYRHIDTAQSYDNEREVGEGVRAAGVPREQVFITTKVWWTNFSAGALEKSAAESLARLKLPFIDLLLLHWPNSSVPLKETIGALCKVKREGLTRHIGVSNFTVALVEEAVALADEPIVNNQIEVHPYMDQSRVIAACRRRGISVTAYSPIARGAVKGEQVLEKIGRARGKTAAQVCLRYLVQQGIVVIPRTSRVERLTENFEIFDFELSAADMAAIAKLGSSAGRRTNPSWAPAWD
ncbi:MAG TPA: aldo/keto reductase [Xanthobacteraceae bacterium]|jgi:diketogulonate reductase-like aldo/keto reductase